LAGVLVGAVYNVSMETKTCKTCKETKPVSDYPKSNQYIYSHCKPCSNKKNREYHAKNKERRHLQHRAWRTKAKYGITIETYDEMLALQNNVCAICFQESKDRALAVDHCHKTGKVRGLLCASCNNGLGRFKDDINLLQKAIEYLGDR